MSLKPIVYAGVSTILKPAYRIVGELIFAENAVSSIRGRLEVARFLLGLLGISLRSGV